MTTDVDTEPDTDDEQAARVEADAQLFQDAHDQLSDPSGILANALMRIHQADATILAPPERDEHGNEIETLEPEDVALYRIASAFVLTHIAREAEKIAENARGWGSDDEDQFADDIADESVEQPTAVRGVRFEVATVVRDLGSGAAWSDAYGYLPTRGLDLRSLGDHTPDTRSPGTLVVLQAVGQVLSRAGDMLLCRTDGGTVLVLPEGAVQLSEDS